MADVPAVELMPMGLGRSPVSISDFPTMTYQFHGKSRTLVWNNMDLSHIWLFPEIEVPLNHPS